MNDLEDVLGQSSIIQKISDWLNKTDNQLFVLERKIRDWGKAIL
jgi:hypothetical protein